MVSLSVSWLVYLEFISLVKSYYRTKKMVLSSSLLGAQNKRDSVENKPESLLVVSLSKTFNGRPPYLCSTPVMGPSSQPVAVARSN